MITDREIILAIVDNDCLAHSDAAILLEGDGFFRFQKAVDLYKKGTVDRIVFSGNIIDRDYGSFPYEEVAPFILGQGVPEKDLIHEDKSRHTREQAVEVVRLAMEKGWKRLALVASHEHQYPPGSAGYEERHPPVQCSGPQPELVRGQWLGNPLRPPAG